MSLPFQLHIPLYPRCIFRDYEDLGRSRKVVDVFKITFLVLPVSYSRSRAAVLSFFLDETPNSVNFFIVPLILGVVLCVYIKVGVDGISAP